MSETGLRYLIAVSDGKILNRMYRSGDKESEEDVTDTPESAYYTIDGKIPEVSEPAEQTQDEPQYRVSDEL